MSLDEFLVWDDGTDRRYELVRGRVVAMAPPAVAHATIVPNLIAALRPKLTRPCFITAEVGITPSERDDAYYQADIAVSCTPTPAGQQYLVDPALIVEVLSPTTATHDRAQKLPDYRRLASVQEIILVSSQERRVELWQRSGEKWEVRDLIGDAVLHLPSVGAGVALAAIYEGVDLSPQAEPSGG